MRNSSCIVFLIKIIIRFVNRIGRLVSGERPSMFYFNTCLSLLPLPGNLVIFRVSVYKCKSPEEENPLIVKK